MRPVDRSARQLGPQAEQRVTLVVAAVAKRAQFALPLWQRPLQAQVAIGREVLAAEGKRAHAVALTFGHRIAESAHGELRILASYLDVDVELPDLGRATRIDWERIAEMTNTTNRAHGLGVGEHDPSLPMLRDRKYSELEAAASLPFEQGRIAPRSRHPHDVVFDLRPTTGRGVDDCATPNCSGSIAIDECALFQLTVGL